MPRNVVMHHPWLVKAVEKFLGQNGKIDFSEWKEDFLSKVESLVPMIKSLERQNVATADQIDALNEKMDRTTHCRVCLQEHLQQILEESNLPEVFTAGSHVKIIQENNLVIDDKLLLPDDLIEKIVETTITPLHRKIRQKIESGETLPGAHLERKKVLRIS